MAEHAGLLAIGDPHLASRALDFRKDDYGRTAMGKLLWRLGHAREHALLPVVLGDLFHFARDNANWLLGEVLAAFATQEVVGVYGNHDCRESALGPDDSLHVLVRAGRYRLLTEDEPWRGRVGGFETAVYGASWGRPLPASVAADGTRTVLVTHHDVQAGARIEPHEIPGLEVVVNGHLHRPQDERRTGGTLWLNPGNICRNKRSDASREAVPRALRLVPKDGDWERTCVEVPHQPYDAVFHEGVADDGPEGGSEFVRGLAELQARRTETGAGLRGFLDENLGAFSPAIRDEIEELAAEVLASRERP